MGCGWIVKGPYTTNCQCVKGASIRNNILKIIDSLSRQYAGILPYVMLQPRVPNPREARVILFDGAAQYIAYDHHRPSNSSALKASESKLFAFAEDAVRKLKKSCPWAILDGLVRVDIFEVQVGPNEYRLYVNEYESLEASYKISKNSQHYKECKVRVSLQEYWRKLLELLVVGGER